MTAICPDSCAKTTLTAVKRQTNIAAGTSAHDARITEIINAVSARITTLLGGREVCAKDYAQWLDGYGSDQITLPQWPVIRLNALASGSARALTVQYTGSDVRATAQVTTTGLQLTSWGTGGATATSVPWTSSTSGATVYETVGEVVTQINDNVTDWTATLVTDGPSSWLRPSAGRDAKTAAMTLYAPDCLDHDAEVQHATGLVQFRSGGAGSRPAAGMGLGGTYLGDGSPMGGMAVLADYRAGFETVPADIEQMAREMVAEIFDRSFRDSALQSESLGGYSYTLADGLAINDRWSAVIDRYTREAVA